MSSRLEELLETLEAAASRKRFRAIDFFEPYDKQRDFFEMGATCRERLLMAGNQLGKTYAGAAETAYHLTGEYPAWWKGRRFNKPITAWAAGETSLLVRDGPQKLLFGKPGVASDLGTGLVPRSSILDTSLARGVTDAFDTIQVQHKTNGIEDGISTIGFKSYEQGRPKFQSATLDFGWADEEPDTDIYSEFLTRMTATGGMLFMTFTPLKGMSDVVCRFLQDPSPDRGVVNMVIEDAKHIDPAEIEKIVAGYPAHEREARRKGIPMLGSGKIFQVSEESIMEPMIPHLPAYWVKLWGIDFGIAHPFAAVLIAWDKDNDVIHVLHCIRIKDQGALQHSVSMKLVGAAVPVAWPQDGSAREHGSGEALSKQYANHGLMMLPDPAMWPTGGNSTEAGITEMDERMKTGRLKIANHLSEWFEEFRLYHRKDGVIVKERDDLMSATRVAIMAKRFARQVQLGSEARKKRRNLIADGVDFDVFGV